MFTIYVGVHTVCLLSMWECILYVYSLSGSAYCMFTIYVGVHTVCLLSMWECILYVYSLCGRAYCMFNFITIIKPAILPLIRVMRDSLLFCEPRPCLVLSG